jgi:hypothetical protein
MTGVGSTVDRWFINEGGKILGSFTLSDLRIRIQKGRLHAGTQVSRNRRDWYFASQVPELFGGLPGDGAADGAGSPASARHDAGDATPPVVVRAATPPPIVVRAATPPPSIAATWPSSGEASPVETSAAWLGVVLEGGRYRVTSKLGEGGMALIYHAWDDRLKTDVVIKVPRVSILMEDPDFAVRFADEIHALVLLPHPHIVKVIDQGRHDGLPYAVMQFLAGGSLEGRRLPLTPDELVAWLEPIAEALDFMHGKGYVHRDVKPANILFDAHGYAYLSDFGIIKTLLKSGGAAQRKGITLSGMVLGTPQYMAPELIEDKPLDGRADQYALAVTVHEALSGRPPIDGNSAHAVYYAQKTQRPPALDTLVPSIRRELAAAVLRGLARERGERFATCREFARAVLAGVGTAAASPRTAGDTSAMAGVAIPTPLRQTPLRRND